MSGNRYDIYESAKASVERAALILEAVHDTVRDNGNNRAFLAKLLDPQIVAAIIVADRIEASADRVASMLREIDKSLVEIDKSLMAIVREMPTGGR